MARITVEDCIDKFPSRFELVLVASNRARKLYSGEDPTVERDNDKNTVIALREIAQETINSDQLKNDLVEEYQTATYIDEDEENKLSEENIIEDNQLDHEKIENLNPEDNTNSSLNEEVANTAETENTAKIKKTYDLEMNEEKVEPDGEVDKVEEIENDRDFEKNLEVDSEKLVNISEEEIIKEE